MPPHKDWDGNAVSVFRTIGASNHVNHPRADHDYYATSPIAAELLLQREDLSTNIWEPACGEKHLAHVFEKAGCNVRCSDIVERSEKCELLDFLKYNGQWNGDIITNPPYSHAQEFVEKALQTVHVGNKVCMFLKLTFLEGQKRKKLFLTNPPVRIWVSSSRISCVRNGDFSKYKTQSSALAYGWYVWIKGYKGDTVVKWMN